MESEAATRIMSTGPVDGARIASMHALDILQAVSGTHPQGKSPLNAVPTHKGPEYVRWKLHPSTVAIQR